MDPIQRFGELFDYDLWANRRAIESLKPVRDRCERGMKIVGHLIGAQRVWLSRFRTPDPPGAQPWPDMTLAEAAGAIDGLHLDWHELLSGISPQRLDENLAYRNTKGTEFKTPIRDVLTHLLMHSAYHRGQIALAVREAGGAPAATDYVVYVRETKSGSKL